MWTAWNSQPLPLDSPSLWTDSTSTPVLGAVVGARPGQSKPSVHLTRADSAGWDTHGHPVQGHPWTSVGIDENKRLSSRIVDSKHKIILEFLETTTHKDIANKEKKTELKTAVRQTLHLRDMVLSAEM